MSLLYPVDTHFYCEDDTVGVKHTWKNTVIMDSLITARNTVIEMVARPNWGIACYMDNVMQSCEVDEKLYHETLVHPAMSTVNAKRVMIIGGGEGATLREVLKWPTVEKVDMYEWDKEVVELFKTKYPQWAKGAWEDKRLQIYYNDIFEVIMKPPAETYDVIIIDLFDPCEENTVQWYLLLKSIQHWISAEGSIAIYSGIRNILVKPQSYHILSTIMTGHLEYANNTVSNPLLENREIIPYKVHIPSFSGESTFLLIKHKNTVSQCTGIVDTHLTDSIWNSYKTFNW